MTTRDGDAYCSDEYEDQVGDGLLCCRDAGLSDRGGLHGRAGQRFRCLAALAVYARGGARLTPAAVGGRGLVIR